MRIYAANPIHEEIKLHRRDLEDKCTNSERFDGQARWPCKSEAASALIYWNGKRYVWYQQGD